MPPVRLQPEPNSLGLAEQNLGATTQDDGEAPIVPQNAFLGLEPCGTQSKSEERPDIVFLNLVPPAEIEVMSIPFRIGGSHPEGRDATQPEW